MLAEVVVVGDAGKDIGLVGVGIADCALTLRTDRAQSGQGSRAVAVVDRATLRVRHLAEVEKDNPVGRVYPHEFPHELVGDFNEPGEARGEFLTAQQGLVQYFQSRQAELRIRCIELLCGKRPSRLLGLEGTDRGDHVECVHPVKSLPVRGRYIPSAQVNHEFAAGDRYAGNRLP